MALRLDIVSDQRQRLGGRASIVFGVAGGSIGRAADNDWVLPDPRATCPGHHARIHFRQGGFYLEDTSSNGVYVNDSVVTPGQARPLCPARWGPLRMGEYRISVCIDVDEAVRLPGTATLSVVAVESVTPLEGTDLGEDDLGASLNIEALMIAPETAAAAKLPPLTYDGSARVGSGPDMSAQERLNRLRAAARARLEGGAAPLADVRTALQAFCRGAGIDSAKLPMESEAQSLHLAGRMFREMLLGLKEILRAQQSFSDRYHIETDKPEGRSPLDQATDDYLIGLFAAHERREFDPVMRLRGFLDHAGEHAAALDPALRAALVQFMAHLSPSGIEARVADIAGSLREPAVLPPTGSDTRKSTQRCCSPLAQELPHLFTEAFAQAFVKRVDEDSGEAFKPPRE